MSEPQNLVVNMKFGRVHRKACGHVNFYRMETGLLARLFLTLDAERRYTEERGWVPCRACHPFKEEA